MAVELRLRPTYRGVTLVVNATWDREKGKIRIRSAKCSQMDAEMLGLSDDMALSDLQTAIDEWAEQEEEV